MILRALGLGDLLTALPALRGLADAFPDHRRVLAAPAALAPLVELAGVVHAVADTAPLAPLDPGLAGVEVAVNLHGRGPQSHRALVAARPGRLIAFRNAHVPETRAAPRWHAHEHEVKRWCRLLVESGVPADPARLELTLSGPPPPSTAGATVIHPGAASPARRWPPERFAAVARAEGRAGRAVVVTGGPAEVQLAREVASAAGLPPSSVLAGATDLLELAAVVAGAARVVCGDTGVAHLATALGTPSVVLFGPLPPAEWGPPASVERHVALWSGRRGDPHGAQPDAGLLEIGVEEVLDGLEQAEGAVHVRRHAPAFAQHPRHPGQGVEHAKT